jgi:hypothetical protein
MPFVCISEQQYFHLEHYMIDFHTRDGYIYCALQRETVNKIRINLSL